MTKKLLVVDDEKSITTILGKIAGELNFEVRTVNEPSKALEAFLLFKPDIVMLDLVMPEIDGIDILRLMLGTGMNPRVVLMTGFGAGYLRLARAVAEMSNGGDIVCIDKPFRRSDVLAILDDWPDVRLNGNSCAGGPTPVTDKFLTMAAA